MTLTARLSPIEAARARHRLADVVRRTGITAPPHRAGVVTVRCPMPAHGHYDRTPSMRLCLDDDRWWCFACSPTSRVGTPMAGDVIDWAQRTEQVDWRGAIAILDSGRPLTNAWSSQTGLATPGPSVAAELPDLGRTPPRRVRDALEAAWSLYTQPSLHLRAVRYLSDRGIDVARLEAHNRQMEIGHTPGPRDGLVNAMRRGGFDLDELVDAGLARRQPGEPAGDFYRNRVLVPIRDVDGTLAGFVGRNVGDARWPKYKNPPRTAVYDKSVNLYQPLPPPAPNGRVVVVEGTFDAMAVAVTAIRAGIGHLLCPITQSGRELSPRQLEHALGLGPKPPLIAFDGDAPGRQSNRRIAVAAQELGCQVLVIDLPDGDDPASWLSTQGIAGLRLFLGAAPSAQSASAEPIRIGGHSL